MSACCVLTGMFGKEDLNKKGNLGQNGNVHSNIQMKICSVFFFFFLIFLLEVSYVYIFCSRINFNLRFCIFTLECVSLRVNCHA